MLLRPPVGAVHEVADIRVAGLFDVLLHGQQPAGMGVEVRPVPLARAGQEGPVLLVEGAAQVVDDAPGPVEGGLVLQRAEGVHHRVRGDRGLGLERHLRQPGVARRLGDPVAERRPERRLIALVDRHAQHPRELRAQGLLPQRVVVEQRVVGEAGQERAVAHRRQDLPRARGAAAHLRGRHRRPLERPRPALDRVVEQAVVGPAFHDGVELGLFHLAAVLHAADDAGHGGGHDPLRPAGALPAVVEHVRGLRAEHEDPVGLVVGLRIGRPMEGVGGQARPLGDVERVGNQRLVAFAPVRGQVYDGSVGREVADLGHGGLHCAGGGWSADHTSFGAAEPPRAARRKRHIPPS